MYIYVVQEHFLNLFVCHCSINMHLFQLKERNGTFPVQETHLSALGMFSWSVNRRDFFFVVVLFAAVMTSILCCRSHTFVHKALCALYQKRCMALKGEILREQSNRDTLFSTTVYL